MASLSCFYLIRLLVSSSGQSVHSQQAVKDFLIAQVICVVRPLRFSSKTNRRGSLNIRSESGKGHKLLRLTRHASDLYHGG